MRRGRALIATLASLALLAAACGGDDEAGAPDGGDQAGELAGVEVEVAAVWTGTEAERFGAVLDTFEEETGAEVTFTSTGDDIAANLGPRLSAGDPPDVAVLPQPGLLRDYAAQGALQPIDDVAGDEVDQNFAPVWRELGTVEGDLYGVWFKAANKSLVWYNTGVFEDAGLEPAEDLDGFLDVARTATDFGVPALSVGGGDGWTLTDWFENVYLRVAGPETYDQLADHEIPWTDQSVKDALEVLGRIFDPSLIAGGPRGALQTDFDTSVTQVFTDPPRAAMVFEADFVAGTITGETDAELGTDAGVFPFPEIEGSGPAVVGGGDVAVLFRDSEGGRALVEFLATPDAARAWAELGGFISPNESLEPDAYPDQTLRDIAQALLEASDSFRFDLSDLQPGGFGQQGGAMFTALQDFLSDTSQVDAVAQQLEDGATRAFG